MRSQAAQHLTAVLLSSVFFPFFRFQCFSSPIVLFHDCFYRRVILYSIRIWMQRSEAPSASA